MPLSEPVAREHLHQRAIKIDGYRRGDGLFDIEAHLTDQRDYGFDSLDRGFVAPGENLHEMWVRLTVDEDMRIIASEAVTDHGPFGICPGGAATMPRLAGMVIGKGFLKEAYARLGGTEGCTHLRELLQQIATTAFQTLWPVRSRRVAATGSPDEAGATRLLGTCFAFASDGPVVRRRWPDRYTGPAADDAPAQLAAVVSSEG